MISFFVILVIVSLIMWLINSRKFSYTAALIVTCLATLVYSTVMFYFGQVNQDAVLRVEINQGEYKEGLDGSFLRILDSGSIKEVNGSYKYLPIIKPTIIYSDSIKPGSAVLKTWKLKPISRAFKDAFLAPVLPLQSDISVKTEVWLPSKEK